MRKLLFSLLAVVFALNMMGVAPIQAQDDFSLKCSAPINGATLGAFPEGVTLWFMDDAEGLSVDVLNADGESVAMDAPVVDGAMVTISLDADQLAAETAYSVVVGEEATELISFTIAAGAQAIEGVELRNDCPAEDMGGDTGDDTDMGDDTGDDTDMGDDTGDDTDMGDEEPALLGESVVGTAGETEFQVGVPTDFVEKEVEGYFLFPVTVMAADEETIDAYVEDPDDVKQFVIIYTAFTNEDLTSFELAEDATPADIIERLIRQDSEAEEPVDAEVAGAPALMVEFTNPESEKSGVFYLVSFEREDGVDYMIIQGSAPVEEWETYAPTFQAVMDSISPVEAE